MDLVLICCKPYRIYCCNYYSGSADMASTVRGAGANRPLTFQSQSNRNRLPGPGFIIPCPVPEPDNCFALFYFVINACISHAIITLIRYFLIPKSRDLVSHNPGISGLKNGPGSRYCNPYLRFTKPPSFQISRKMLFYLF